MSKKKPIDKAQTRERRNQLLASAAAAKLSLKEGVREMRAISGMTQEEFAEHRGVSPRVIKAIELDKGNPTVATLNRIGEFFGLEVGFVPVRRPLPTSLAPNEAVFESFQAPAFADDGSARYFDASMMKNFHEILKSAIDDVLSAPDLQRQLSQQLQNVLIRTGKPVETPSAESTPPDTKSPIQKKKKQGPPD